MDSKQRRMIDLFNDELYSLFSTKPPVSKTKMVAITRAAIKGVKYYKHIVKIVEKFIYECNSEYKVPGLYVIDSIVRQSRHQFGIELDVYAARFSRNLQSTFENLFTGCNNDDKPKIVRVLNLWLKNGVFNSQVIQPLLDMANPNSSLLLISNNSLENNNNNSSDKLGQSSRYMNNSNSQYNNNGSSRNIMSSSSTSNNNNNNNENNNKKNIIDFDYEDEDDDDDDVDISLNNDNGQDGDETPTEAEPPLSSTLSKIEMEQRKQFDKSANHHHHHNHQHQLSSRQQQMPPTIQNNINQSQRDIISDPVLERWNKLLKQKSITSESNSKDSNILLHDNKNFTRQRSRSRSPVDVKVAQKFNLPKEQLAPTFNEQTKNREKSSDRKAERDAERARKCLPPIRDKHLTVCSSTLWLGHVPKTISEADLSDAFGEYGTITSINLIPPRGCAYVCMDRRQDAKRALKESRDLKLNGNHVKMAWAPGKGFKEYKKLKDFWEADIGSSYIPYNKIDSSIDFDVLEEGGVIDEDSMSMEMRETRERKAKEKEEKDKVGTAAAAAATATVATTSVAVTAAQPTIQPNVGLNLPIPTLPILTQPPPSFNHLANQQPNQLTNTIQQQQNYLALPQTNQLGQSHNTHDQINLSQANQLNLSQPPPPFILSAGNLNLSQPNFNMNIPPPNLAITQMNLGIPPMNVLNLNQSNMSGDNLQFSQQSGMPFWG